MDTKALRQKILDLAIRGKLVPQDPKDEPASVLLEKIRAEKQQMVKDGRLKAKDIKNDTIIFKGEDNLHYEKFNDGSVKCIEDEITFELPEGWAWCRVSSIANFLGGYAYKSNKYIPESKNMIIRIGNVKNNKLNPYIAQTCISDEYAIETQGYKICVGDILFTMTGTKGKRDYFFSCLIKDDDIEGTNLFLNQRVGCLRLVDNTKIIAEYLVSAIQTTDILDAIFATETGNVNQGNIGSVATLNLLVPIPPTNEQTKISKKLNKILTYLDKHDVESEELVKIIQNLKSKILDLAIRGQLVPQNPDDEPASVLLERIKAEKEELIKAGKIKRDKKESFIFKGEDNSYYETIDKNTTCIDDEIPFIIPNGWAWCRLQSISSILTDGTHKTPEYSDSGYLFLSSKNVISGKIDWENVMYIPEYLHEELYERLAPAKDDILLAKNGTTGIAAMVDRNEVFDIYVSLALIRIVNNLVFPSYVLYAIGSPYVQEYFNNSLKGIGVPNLHLEHIRKTLIPIPPHSEQKQIAELLKNIFLKMDDISNTLA